MFYLIVVFFVVISLIISAASFYVGQRLIIPSPLSPVPKFLAWIVVFLPLLVFPMRALEYYLYIKNPVFDIFKSFVFIDMGFLSIVLAFVIGKDCAVLLGKFLIKSIERFRKKETKRTFSAERRRLILNCVNGGIVSVAGGLSVVGIAQAVSIPKLKRVSVVLDNLPSEFEGFKILQLTDLHINQSSQANWLKGFVGIANSCDADIVALTGDLSDSRAEWVKHLFKPLSGLVARHGRFFVTGNHEYYVGADAWITEVKKLGFKVLMNEHIVIERGTKSLLIGGVPDIHAKRYKHTHVSDPFKAILGGEGANCKILLAHQPQSIYQAEKAGFDLQISGHTHGGQFFPWTCVTRLVQPYLQGLHCHNSAQIYVSRGTGYWGPPLRIGATSEITLLTLHKA